jgi:ribosomal protein L6P/L9E
VAEYISKTTFNSCDFVCYSESKYILVYGYLGILKFRSSIEIISYISNSRLSIFNDSFDIRYISNKLYISVIARCFWGTCFGYFLKYRIKGLGHRIYIKQNNFVYKIGYSHTIYKMLDLNLLNYPKRFKKEYYFAIRGIENMNVINALLTIQSYRIPNCYCFNGIFIHGITVEAKEGKKGFFL